MDISVSRLKAFKACPRMYWLKYHEGLKPLERADALETGTKYHELIAALNEGRETGMEFDKEHAMAEAYKKYILPRVDVKEAEVRFEMDIEDSPSDRLVGIVDGIMADGGIVEHKTTGAEITEEYEYDLQWDEQIPAYCKLTGYSHISYTVCRKPTIRLKKGESDEEFFHRMVDWYAEDTDKKIKLLSITRTPEEVDRWYGELVNTLSVIHGFGEDEKGYYRNTCHCHKWGRRCEYADVCLDYDPNMTYVGYERKGGHNEDDDVSKIII